MFFCIKISKTRNLKTLPLVKITDIDQNWLRYAKFHRT